MAKSKAAKTAVTTIPEGYAPLAQAAANSGMPYHYVLEKVKAGVVKSIHPTRRWYVRLADMVKIKAG